jgi:Yip1 domain
MSPPCSRADLIVSVPPKRYHFQPMIKALFLIFGSHSAWERVVEAGRGLAFVFAFYLLPMLLILAAAEGYGLMEWGKVQVNSGLVKKLTANEMVVFETAQTFLTLLVIVVCTYAIKSLGETFHGRHNYTRAFSVVAYGLSPLFLFQLLNAFPSINLWLVWVVGIMLALKALYHGVPMVMQTDPTHALGLYFMSALVIFMLTGLERFFTAWYLSGHSKPLADSVSAFAAKLPF